MERRRLGRTKIELPVIGMGTWRTFDTEEDRSGIVDEALEAGIDLFDSSPMYGKAEATLARALQGRRRQVRVATKIWTEDAEAGRRQAEYALALYGTVDIYQVHNLVNLPAQLGLIERLKGDGKVLAVGATHYQDSAFADLAAAMRGGRLEMVQIPYSPVRREAERELLPLAEELGLGVLVMSPLRGGVLDREPGPEVLAELGVESWPEAILKWIRSDPRVTSVLTATQRPGRPRANARAGEGPCFSPEQRDLVVRLCAAA